MSSFYVRCPRMFLLSVLVLLFQTLTLKHFVYIFSLLLTTNVATCKSNEYYTCLYRYLQTDDGICYVAVRLDLDLPERKKNKISTRQTQLTKQCIILTKHRMVLQHTLNINLKTTRQIAII